ncbi:MAG: hypothetical protein HY874_12630 [Chloroflexi bacterium]|nr:hypothetical protein [Chloroflexota bacterium]
MGAAFERLFDRWFIHERDNEALALEVEALCDEAWRSREPVAWGDVMVFVSIRKDTKRYHYFIEALQSSDLGISLQAVGYVATVGYEGYHFSPEQREVIMTFAQHHPDLQDLVDDMLAEN